MSMFGKHAFHEKSLKPFHFYPLEGKSMFDNCPLFFMEIISSAFYAINFPLHGEFFRPAGPLPLE